MVYCWSVLVARGALGLAIAATGCGRLNFETKLPDADDADGATEFVLDVQVGSSTDDAEEVQTTLGVTVDGTELQVGQLNSIGLRFAPVSLPVGASIARAFVRVVANRNAAGAMMLVAVAEAAESAAPFVAQDSNISSRPSTVSSVGPWDWAPWSTGATFETPDLAVTIRDVISQPGWASGNAIVLKISAASGNAAIVAFDGAPAMAAVLHIEAATTR